MKYHKPDLALGVLLPPQTTLQDKFGGLPWGLPQERWPLCAECGSYMTFLAQVKHHSQRLDLGALGRVLYIFMCSRDPGRCATWDADSGANAAVILEQSELSEGACHLPSPSPETEVEARVLEWKSGQDPVSEEQFSLFFNSRAYDKLPYEVREEVFSGTKLGGAPVWLQSAPKGLSAPYCFAAQFDSHHVFDPPAPSLNKVGGVMTTFNSAPYQVVGESDSPSKSKRTKKNRVEIDLGDYQQEEVPTLQVPTGPREIIVSPKGIWFCAAANYGEGRAYLFVDPDPKSPSGKFLWQR